MVCIRELPFAALVFGAALRPVPFGYFLLASCETYSFPVELHLNCASGPFGPMGHGSAIMCTVHRTLRLGAYYTN